MSVRGVIIVCALAAFVVAGVLGLRGRGEPGETTIRIVDAQVRQADPPGEDYELKPGQVAVIETDFGEIVFELLYDKAPETVRNFAWLANEQEFYDGLKFHRVVKDELIQGGCPYGSGKGTPGYTIKDELNDVHHGPGAVGLVHGGAPNSGGSQFYILLADWAHLDGWFAVFGKVIKGLEVVRKISVVDVDPVYERPSEPVYMRKVRVVDRESVDLE